MRSTCSPGWTGLAALAFCLLAGPALAGFGPQSTATGIDAKFQSGGMATELGPIGALNGQASGRYSFSQTVASVNESTPLAPTFLPPTVFANGTNLKSQVTSTGLGVDSRSSGGSAFVGAANIALNINPPPGSGMPIPYPLLNVSAHQLSTTAGYSQVVPAGAFVSGSATVGSLTITGQLLGGATLHYAGVAPPNTVIFDSPKLTITLNRQLKAGLISCTPTCKFTPYSIDVSAVFVEVRKATLGGKVISGDIALAEATAQ